MIKIKGKSDPMSYGVTVIEFLLIFNDGSFVIKFQNDLEFWDWNLDSKFWSKFLGLFYRNMFWGPFKVPYIHSNFTL